MIIDLGTDRTMPEVRSKSALRRNLLSAAVALNLILAAALGGSAVAHQALRPVAAAPATVRDNFVLLGDHLFVLGFAGNRIDAYAVPGGAHLWQATTSRPVAFFRADTRAEVLLLQNEGDGASGQVSALVAGTGRVLWRREESRLPNVDFFQGAALLLAGAGKTGAALVLMDLNTGAERWSHPFPAGSAVLAGSPGYLVVQSPAGIVELLDERDGRTVVSGRLDAASDTAGPDDASPPSGPSVYPTGELVLTLHAQANGTVVTAYRATTFERVWQVTTEESVHNIAGCGPVICLNADQRVTAVDPSTGRTIWRREAVTVAGAVDGWLQARAAHADGGNIVLLQPTTGSIRLSVTDWTWVPGSDLGGEFLLTRSQPGLFGVWVGSGDAAKERIAVRGWLPEAVNSQCQVSEAEPGQRYLACPMRNGGVRVWRYEP